MAITTESIKQALTEKFGEPIVFENPDNMVTVTVPAAQILKVLLFLKEEQGFIFLTDIAAVHYPDRAGEELAVVYHLHNLYDNIRLRLKVYVPVAQPDVFTATQLYPGANWMERETYDYFGVNFVGHPDLRRILNPDEMDYFPMRKEYTLEDPQRTDKDDEMFGR
jgi:NADH-quinone oxidoreductase subunit C